MPQVIKLRPLDYLVFSICFVVIPSAVIHSIVGGDEKIIFAVLTPVVIFAAILDGRTRMSGGFIFACCALIMIGCVATIVADSFSQLLMGATLSVAILVARLLCLTVVKPNVLRALSWFTFAMLVAGAIGTVYAYVGGKPIIELKVGYRTTYLYLTTFSFAETGGFLRPAGIFDEPGALAMYAAIVTMFNDMLRQNRMLNLAIVTLLILTGSLAGLIIIVLFFTTSNSERAFRKTSMAFIIFLGVAYLFASNIAPDNALVRAVDAFYSERIQWENGKLSGDNRSIQIDDFFQIVDERMLLRGEHTSADKRFIQDMSSNPFSITFGYGLIISLPYFVLLIWLAVTLLSSGFRNIYTCVGLLLLLLQRPYIYHMSWSILIASAVILLYYTSRVTHPNCRSTRQERDAMAIFGSVGPRGSS